MPDSQIKNAYAHRILAAMAVKRVRGKLGHFTKRDLANAVGVKYESVRRILSGDCLYVSRKMHDKICRVMGLDAQELWVVLSQIKAAARYDIKPKLVAPRDNEIRSSWDYLTEAQQANVRDTVLRMVEENRLELERRERTA